MGKESQTFGGGNWKWREMREERLYTPHYSLYSSVGQRRRELAVCRCGLSAWCVRMGANGRLGEKKIQSLNMAPPCYQRLVLTLIVLLAVIPRYDSIIPSTRGLTSRRHTSLDSSSQPSRRRALCGAAASIAAAASMTIHPSASFAASGGRTYSPLIPINQLDPSLVSSAVSQSSIDQGGEENIKGRS